MCRASFPYGLAIVFAVLTGCSSAPPEAPPLPEVDVAAPIVRTIVDYAEFTGRTDSVDSVQIKARVSGYLDAVKFKEGDEVTEGTTLYQIDPRPYQAAVEQDEADLANKKATLTTKRGVYNRAKKLLGQKSIEQEDFEIRKGDFEVAEAAVRQAAGKLEVSRLNLEWTEVKAPISGRLSRALVTRGNLVTADNTLLTTMVSLDPIWVYFTVDERTLLRLRALAKKSYAGTPGQAVVELGLATDQGYPHKGTLNFEDNKVDQGTGTMLMRGVFANPKIRDDVRLLSPGLFARVRLTVGLPRTGILVADRALGTDQGKKYVYVIGTKADPKTGETKQVVERRYVDIGDLHDGLREIKPEAKQTVEAKDRVVISGLQRIRPGAEVKSKQVEMPAISPKDKGKAESVVSTRLIRSN